MYKYLCILVIILTTFSAASKDIAITFDDAPRPDSRLFTGEERTKKLIENLKKANVPDVFFFVTTQYFTEKSKKRIKAYTEAGFHLGNHSHSHFSAHSVDTNTYLEDITTAHNNLKIFDNVAPFYRYPYLKEGKDIQTRDRIRQHLKDIGYKNGYVTIDNFDWYMDSLLQKALSKGEKVNYEVLKSVYISVLWESILFYDRIAQASIGRSPKHVLLLHENDIAALFIDDLVEHIRLQGWNVISPQEAYKDTISQNAPNVLFNDQGRVAAIAKSKGWDNKFLRGQGSSKAYLDEYFKKNEVFSK